MPYGVAFQTCPLIGLVTDWRAVIRDANRAALTFFGVDHAVLVGKPLLHFVARGDTRSFRERARDLSQAESLVVALRPRGGQPRRMRLTIQRASARLVWWICPASGLSPGARMHAVEGSMEAAT
jgi:PAS domain S-box-containing protein